MQGLLEIFVFINFKRGKQKIIKGKNCDPAISTSSDLSNETKKQEKKQGG